MVLRYNSGNKGGIRLSKLNYSYHRFLNNNRNKGIPNLMLWICIGNALVYFLSQFGTPLSLYSALSFDPQAIAHGQVWRLQNVSRTENSAESSAVGILYERQR